MTTLSNPHVKRNSNLRSLQALGAQLLVLALLEACGGGDKKVNTPANAGGADPQAAVAAVPGITNAPPEAAQLEGGARDAYARGWAAWSAGDLAGAKMQFADSVSKDGRSPATHYALASVLDRLGEKVSAQQSYRTSYTVKPDFDLGMCGYAFSLARSGHVGEADGFLSERRQNNPNSARIATCLAEVKSMQNDSATAQQLAQAALTVDPDFKEAMVVVARDRYRAHQLELAKYALEAILEGFGDKSPARDVGNPEALLIRGLIAREQGSRMGAMSDFEKALQKRPDFVEALIQVGSMKLEAGNAGEAMPLLEKAVRFDPNNALAHVNLGDAYRLLGRPQEAKREFDTSLNLDSTLAIAHYDLGLLYLFTPNFPGATPDSQVSSAIKEFETYKSMKGGKGVAGDDIEELLSRAKAKQNELKQAGAAK